MPWSDLFAAARFWLVLAVLGLLAVPLAFAILGDLADKGYAFVKMVGLLLLSTTFWLLASLGFAGNSLGGILLALATLGGLSGWAYRRQAARLLPWLRQNWRHLLLVEALFLLFFVLWVWVRSLNPAITATEKPMEFAFLNAVGRSPVYPPGDPWLSGFAISYYYFGYVMVSVLGRLAGVAEPLAFNLGLAWLLAGTATGAFGLVYNLVMSDRLAGARRRALVFGLVAAVALPLAGNMEILLEVLHGHNVGSPAFWQWLDVRDLNGPASEAPRYLGSDWWWWRSSRVINEYHLSGRNETGLNPIAEFPAFSFVLGDLHPHVLALPFAFLSLALALSWWNRPGADGSGKENGSLFASGVVLSPLLRSPRFWFTALLLGGLSFLNTWDVLIHLFLVAGAYLLGRWRQAGRWENGLLRQAGVMALLWALPAFFLYLPFYLGFRSQAGAPFLLPFLMRPTRLSQFLVIFAMPLWAIIWLVGNLAWQRGERRWPAGILTFLLLLGGLFLLLLFFGWLIAISPEGYGRVSELAGELGLSLPDLPAQASAGSRLSWGSGAVAALAPVVLRSRLQSPWLALFLAGLAALAVMLLSGKMPAQGRHQPLPPGLPFALLLILTGALLTLGPEFLYLRDNFGQRLNTIFKFYYQAWVLFGVAALYALAYLLPRARLAGLLATAGYGALLATSLLFPLRAVQSRAAEYAGPPTLNGMAYLQQFNPDEYAALMWLRQNAPPQATVLEAVGGQYTGYARVAANTGLPTVLGWAGHEQQWRGFANPEPGRRDRLVKLLFSTTDWSTASLLLNELGVDFVYVGNLERADFGPAGVDKFAAHMAVAFQNGSVTIYRWQPTAIAGTGGQ